jgi:hypothetical protein
MKRVEVATRPQNAARIALALGVAIGGLLLRGGPLVGHGDQ